MAQTIGTIKCSYKLAGGIDWLVGGAPRQLTYRPAVTSDFLITACLRMSAPSVPTPNGYDGCFIVRQHAMQHTNHNLYKRHRLSADLILPLKLCPHAPELDIRTAGGADVVHDVNVDVIEHHHAAVCIG